MIQISLTTALFLYSAVIVIGLTMLYAVSELRARHVYHTLERQFLWRCAFCGYLYLDESALTVSQCPRCDSFNEARDAQDRRVSAARARSQPDSVESTHEPKDDAPRRNPARKKQRHARRGPRRRR